MLVWHKAVATDIQEVSNNNNNKKKRKGKGKKDK